MPDTRQHRGPAPRDERLFAPSNLETLRRAVEELSWLLGRGYPDEAALQLVGNRHDLTARQRKAVERCACADTVRNDRRARRLDVCDLSARRVDVDAFNCIILCESVLGGAVVLAGRDGALRDLASVHGTWRRVAETPRVIESLGEVLDASGASAVRWVLDRPVSNSGRLAGMLREAAEAADRPWAIELRTHVDRGLAASDAVVASADSWILDRCGAWVDLPRAVLEHRAPDAWLVDLDA